MRTEPILRLNDDEEVRSMLRDPSTGSVLVGTSHGRILLIQRLASNAYLAGNRTIYATRNNCRGETSATGLVNIRYGLINKVVEMTDSMAVTRWKDVIRPMGADVFSKVSGVFYTPVLWAGEDFGWWGDASWSQSLEGNGRVVIAMRAAGSEEALLASPWKTMESKTSGQQTWSLDSLSAAGGYAQMKIVLESSSTEDSPIVSSLVLPYHSKYASYFFVTKITMTKKTSIRGGILTASVSVPRNTEVKWGVSDGRTSDWNDFVRIEPDKLFTLSEDFGDRMKIGVKMLSYDDERYPSVDEFSVAFDSDIDNLINKD